MKRILSIGLSLLLILMTIPMGVLTAHADVSLPIDWFGPAPDPKPDPIASGTTGDLDGDGEITDEDAVWLLLYTFFPDDYPISQSVDYDGDGEITDEDAVWLLLYTFFPDDYPIA